MERPRYREAAPGGSGPGGGSSAAWNGSCGPRPRCRHRQRVSPTPRMSPALGVSPTPGLFKVLECPQPRGSLQLPVPPGLSPSPSRDLPCGLGCRHRRPPERPRRPPATAPPPRGARCHHRQGTRPPARGPRCHHRQGTARVPAGGPGGGRALPAPPRRPPRAALPPPPPPPLLPPRRLRGLRRSRELLAERFRPRAGHHRGGDSDEEVTRLVAMAEVAEEELDPFRVLGVEPTATDAELRRAYRRLAVLVHPDKSRDPRAEAAFKVLWAGWERVSSPERRREYQFWGGNPGFWGGNPIFLGVNPGFGVGWERVSSPERRREYQAKQLAQGELARALGAFLGRLQEELRDARDAMGCTRCGGRHRRFQLDRDPRGGRWCGPCGGWHAADEGDLWAESSLMGLKVTYLARMDGHIYDVTEWAGCQRVAISPDSHRVPYHLSFGARTATPAGRQRAPPKGSPPTPADLEDFLARVFQGNPGPEPGGAFPAPPGAAGPPQGHPQPQGGPPKGDTKHKRRKKGRRPLPR
ncbi:dnaJ homolog subfamily C member 14-like [Melospiza melodia melodia]|uniref:dnaJ homolog subfamily C member 14-like n=1 Tax=Melospiza melodia melodia TaxID=1914991 RepID=UPI002FD67DD3